jgi:hypothetical protein
MVVAVHGTRRRVEAVREAIPGVTFLTETALSADPLAICYRTP